jgi:benzoate 4-monooxygenase
MLELQIIIASIMRRYDIVLQEEGQKVCFELFFFSPDLLTKSLLQLETREGFLRKPLGCKIGVKRRDV